MAYEEIMKGALDVERDLLRAEISRLQAKLADIDARDPEIIEREHDRYYDGLFGLNHNEAPKTEDEALDRIFETAPARELTEDEKLDRMLGLDNGVDERARNNTSAFVPNGVL